jgi:hypothetical protein
LGFVYAPPDPDRESLLKFKEGDSVEAIGGWEMK